MAGTDPYSRYVGYCHALVDLFGRESITAPLFHEAEYHAKSQEDPTDLEGALRETLKTHPSYQKIKDSYRHRDFTIQTLALARSVIWMLAFEVEPVAQERERVLGIIDEAMANLGAPK
jgi:hypothetical protein